MTQKYDFPAHTRFQGNNRDGTKDHTYFRTNRKGEKYFISVRKNPMMCLSSQRASSATRTFFSNFVSRYCTCGRTAFPLPAGYYLYIFSLFLHILDNTYTGKNGLAPCRPSWCSRVPDSVPIHAKNNFTGKVAATATVQCWKYVLVL